MMEMDNGTEQLIIELREGKECAFVKVFRTYYAPLLNYAGRILHDTELANDVVQGFVSRVPPHSIASSLI